MALSLSASFLGRLVWETRPGSEDLLFSELMIWGFLNRRRTQRRLASALELLGPMSDPQRRPLDGPGTKEQARLLEQLVAGMETRDPYLHGHSRRVARHSWMIARRMGLAPIEVARIRTAAAIHDVGKIKTPKTILHKAGPLTEHEYDVIKRHPGDGGLMAAVLHDAELTSMVRHHHERLDGTGYPDGLSGEKIPLGARIIAVADTFDAITSARPYRPASPHKRAIDILKADAGTRLDPTVVRAFCSHYAGRGPLAIWSFVSGLPERVVSWLGGGVASIASAAKIAAVAVLVGGAAATTSTIAAPPAKTHSNARRQPGLTTVQTRMLQSAGGKGTAGTTGGGAPTARHGGGTRATPAPSAARGAQPASSGAGATVGAGSAGSRSPGAGSAQGTPVPGKGKTEPPGKTKTEPPGKGKTAPPGKTKTEPPGKTKTEPPGKGTTEPPGKTKAGAPGKGTAPPPGKTEPPKVKTEPPPKAEPPAKVKTEPPAKSEPAPKVPPAKAEPPGKVK
jgi:hypothetical protein